MVEKKQEGKTFIASFFRRTQKQNPIKKKQYEKEPWFYCSLCYKTMKYNELIDGCRCCFCDNDLFIIPWNEYESTLPPLFLDEKQKKTITEPQKQLR